MLEWMCSIRGRIFLAAYHEHQMQIKPFYIDKYPVTNAEFKKFLDATHYQPKDDSQFSARIGRMELPGRLGKQARHLGFTRRCARVCEVGGQAPPARMGVAIRGTRKRQTDVSLGQLRLDYTGDPRQPPGLSQPTNLPMRLRRFRTRGASCLPPSDVDAHPKGASPYGVMDMVGNVWQWTDEYQDEHTRAAILAEAATISRKAPCGISRRHIETMNTESIPDVARLRPFRSGGISLRKGCPVRRPAHAQTLASRWFR